MPRCPTQIMEHLTYHVDRPRSQRALRVGTQVLQILISFIFSCVLISHHVLVCNLVRS